MSKAKGKPADESRDERPDAGRPSRGLRPVRLDLADADHERLERAARRRGLSKAAFARMVILDRLETEEPRSRGEP
jgi:hypothetical protein